MEKLGQSAAAVQAYFDIFEHKLTDLELYILGDESSLHVIPEIREANCPGSHRKRQQWIATKMKRVRKAGRLLRYVPFVQMVAVCNTLAAGHPSRHSDLDVFIVIKDGRLWLGRLFVTAWMQLWGMRRHGSKISDHVCLSFYITPAAADLSKVAIERDIYLKYWIAQLLPLWSRGDTLKQFWQQNKWAWQDMPNLPEPLPLDQNKIPWITKISAQSLSGRIGDLFEKTVKRYQKERIESRYKTRVVDSAVVVDDTMLKFHENDRRIVYRQKWEKKLAMVKQHMSS